MTGTNAGEYALYAAWSNVPSTMMRAGSYGMPVLSNASVALMGRNAVLNVFVSSGFEKKRKKSHHSA